MSLNIFKHLLPRAQAWSLTISKQLRDFFDGLCHIVTDYKEFMDLIWLDIFPSTTRELAEWETQWGLTAGALTEQERRDRLDATWKAIGGQDPRYIQDTLQAAGFPVFIHEWWELPATNPPVARDPRDFLEDEYTGGPKGYPLVNLIQESSKAFTCLCGEPLMEAGEDSALCGEFSAFVLSQRTYNITSNPDTWPYYLYLGGETFPTLAQIPASRRLEFERLCLKICPAQQWLGILVEYV